MRCTGCEGTAVQNSKSCRACQTKRQRYSEAKMRLTNAKKWDVQEKWKAVIYDLEIHFERQYRKGFVVPTTFLKKKGYM